MWGRREHKAYVASEDEVVHHADNLAHRLLEPVAAAGRIVKIDALAIAQQATRQQLVVDVQRCCPQVVCLCHGRGGCTIPGRGSLGLV